MKVQLDTVQFALHVRKFGNDDKKAAAWLRSFADTLLFEGNNPDAEPLAAALVAEAGNFKATQSLIKMRAAAVKAVGEGDEDAIDEWMAHKYGDKYEAVKGTIAKKQKNLSADGDIHEDSLNIPDGSDAANLESRPSADTRITEPATAIATDIVATKAPRKMPHGEFHNVMLTDEEMNSLRAKVYNADALVEELSQYLASSGRRYKSHYATLLNWCRRKEKEGEPKQKFLTTDEISRRNYEQSQQVLNRIMEERRHG